MGRISAAVLGTGFIGSVHFEALRRLGFVDVVATAHSSEAAARSAREKRWVDVGHA